MARRKRKITTDAYLNRGYVHNQRGEYAKGLKAFQKALELEPNSAAAHNNLGATYILMNKREEAIFHLRQALALDASLEEVRINLADVYVKQDKYEEAREVLIPAMARGKEPESYYYLLGRVYFGLCEYEAALQAWLKSRELGMTKIDLNLFIGNAYFYLEDFDQAFYHFQQLTRNKPDFASGYSAIAMVYMKRKQFDAAEQALADALMRDPSDWGALYLVDLLEQERKAHAAESAS